MSEPEPRVYLFTETYPFTGPDDPFLKPEVRAVGRSMNVILIPTRVCSGSSSFLPDGVTCDRRLSDYTAQVFVRVWSLLRAIVLPSLYVELAHQSPHSLNPRAVVTVLTRLARALAIENWVRRNLRPERPERPSIIYSWWSSATAYGLARALNSSGVPFVTRAHGYDLYAEQERVGFVPFQRQVIARADAVYSASHAGADYLCAGYPDLAEKIATAYLGIDGPNELGQPSADGTMQIVSCSSLVSVKRVNLLAEALSVLATSTPFVEFHWTHIGAGPLAEELAARVASLRNLRGRVTFLGYLQPEDVRRWYSEHPIDLFVNVSESEGLPVSLMEAASFGIPMLATAVGGTPEIVRNGAGILIPVDSNPQQVAEAIAGYLRLDPADKDTMRAASRARFESDFRADTNYGAFAGLLSEMAHAS